MFALGKIINVSSVSLGVSSRTSVAAINRGRAYCFYNRRRLLAYDAHESCRAPTCVDKIATDYAGARATDDTFCYTGRTPNRDVFRFRCAVSFHRKRKRDAGGRTRRRRRRRRPTARQRRPKHSFFLSLAGTSKTITNISFWVCKKKKIHWVVNGLRTIGFRWFGNNNTARALNEKRNTYKTPCNK